MLNDLVNDFVTLFTRLHDYDNYTRREMFIHVYLVL